MNAQEKSEIHFSAPLASELTENQLRAAYNMLCGYLEAQGKFRSLEIIIKQARTAYPEFNAK